MTVTPTEFRNNLFSMLDSVINEKEHIDINRNGTIIHLVPERKKSRLESLTPANFQNCSDEELEDSVLITKDRKIREHYPKSKI